MGRDSWIAQGTAVSPGWLRDCGRIFLDSNTGRMPRDVEEGLLALFSTLEIHGTRVTLGAPPPQPTPAWARMHLLAVNPEYSGKLRVLLANLSQGMEEEPAYRNAFGKGPAEIAKEADVPGTIALSGRAIDPDFSFPARSVEPSLARVVLADLHPNPRGLRSHAGFRRSARGPGPAGLARGPRRGSPRRVPQGSRTGQPQRARAPGGR